MSILPHEAKALLICQ